MGNVVQSFYGKARPSPPSKVVLQVQLPPDGAGTAEDLRQNLEECATKWIAKNTGMDGADSGYMVDAIVVH